MDGNLNTSEQVLILVPTSTDSATAVNVLEGAGICTVALGTLSELCRRIADGCGAVVISDEALTTDETLTFQSILESQESWSDLPIILFTSSDPMSVTKVFMKNGNILLLERPFSPLTLIRTVEVALRARRKQYEVRRLLAQQALATEKRDEFFSTLSHELRTPLNVILGWLEVIRLGKLDTAAEAEAMETLKRNAQLQKGLIDDLLDVSRIVTGKMALDLIPSSLADIVRTTTKSFVPQAREKGVFLHLVETAEVLPVMADEQRLSQVISNLISNAVKFTPCGGTITVSTLRDFDTYVLSVEDTGQGVEPSFLPFMFDRLKQEDMSTTRRHGGLGLGLAIAAHIVEEHEGSITAESEGRGYGMKVHVILPVIGKEKIISQKLPTITTNPSLKGLRVLVVDDSPDILHLLRLWLGKAEAEVRLTSSAAGALHELSTFRPDVLLSDIGMPEMDGYQLISKIRSMPNGSVSDFPAVALTAYTRNEERLQAINAGFQMHISKPISSHQLVSAIATLVKH